MNQSNLRITVASLFVVFMVSGCQNPNADIVGPEQLTGEPTPVMIELSTDDELAKRLYADELITVEAGGEVELSFQDRKGLTVYMKLEFEPGSVSNDFRASLRTDTKYLTSDMALTFGPHGTTFLRPAKLTISVSGLDVSAFQKFDRDNDKKVSLDLYYTSSAKWEKMNGSITVDLTNGTLTCVGAELPHFSRYSFGI